MSYKEQADKASLALKEYFSDSDAPYGRLLEAMRYSLNAGGKRLRPALVLEFCLACGGDADRAMPVACACEMLHTYSLIHDDLPCMDDDDLRRGKPTNHKVFGECTAVLAGDALQAEAFAAILGAEMPDSVRVRCAALLAKAAGADGICGGQQLDMEAEGTPVTEERLMEINLRKTASLLAACCAMGAVAGGGDEEQIAAAERFGTALGLAFQVRDDVLDEISNNAQLGKPVGSDLRQGKTTFMTLWGQEKCEAYIETLTKQAKAELAVFPHRDDLETLADEMSVRNK